MAEPTNAMVNRFLKGILYESRLIKRLVVPRVAYKAAVPILIISPVAPIAFKYAVNIPDEKFTPNMKIKAVMFKTNIVITP